MESAWGVRAHLALGSVFDGGVGMVSALVEEVCPAFGVLPLRQPGAAFPRQQLRPRIDRFEHDPIHDSSSAKKLNVALNIALDDFTAKHAVAVWLYYMRNRNHAAVPVTDI